MPLIPMDPRDAMARAMWEDNRDFNAREDAMTLAEVTIVQQCAAAICDMCGSPSKWHPVRLEDGDYYHVKVNRFDEAGTWCDANGIWQEFPEAVPSP